MALLLTLATLFTNGCATEHVGKTIALFAREKENNDSLRHEVTFPRAVPYMLQLCGPNQGKAPAENGTVKITWREHYLNIAADFEDSDIFARGQTDNEPHYKLGDVLEVFLKPEYSDWYWEIWLTPHGRKTSVFWPGQGESAGGADNSFRLNMDYAAGIVGTLNDSSDKDQGWHCAVDIPFEELAQSGKLHKKGDWTILLARQNYTGSVDKDHRELSSHPALSECNFHAHREYHLLDLALDLNNDHNP